MDAPLLKVENLSLHIHSDQEMIPILDNINFSINNGKTLALVGESGSGKSLTALAIMQLLPLAAFIDPKSAVFFHGEDLFTYPEIKMRKIRGRKIAMIFQEAITALNPVLTIGQQLMEVYTLHFNFNRREKYRRAINLLTEVGMPDPKAVLSRYPHQLSGGLKQRAMIAIALAGEPDLLIADEPTTALDVTLQAQIITLLKSLQQKRGMGLIFITHDLGIVYQVADQVAVLYKGAVVESAPAKLFFQAPTHPYTLKLFASLPGWLSPPVRSSEETEPLLIVRNLKVYYPIKSGLLKRTSGFVKAVDNVSLEIKRGKTLALVGESGSGKTTTGMAILRLVNISAGHILFEGRDLTQLNVAQMRAVRKDYQVVFQDPYGSMNPHMLVGNIIEEGMKAQNISKSVAEQKTDELLRDVGLSPEVKQRYPHEFSGGQRQRICIARALAIEPKLLICDEPTSALDVSAQMQVLQLLLKLQQEKGLAYLLITHNIAVVSYMADEVAVMHRGEIVEYGSAQHVLNNPQHPYTQTLLKAVPMIPPFRQDVKLV